MLLGIGDLLLPGQAPFPSRGNDIELRGEGSNADIEPHLVISLPSAAMSHRRSPFLAGGIHHQFGDQGASQRCGQGVLPLIEGISLKSRENEVFDKKLPGIHHQSLYRPRIERLLLNASDVLFAPNLSGKGDDIHAVLFNNPSDSYRGI